MGNTSTFRGRVRSKGGRVAASPTTAVQSVMFCFDYAITTPTLVRVGTSPTTGEFLTLPKGTNVLRLGRFNSAVAGASPTVNIGILGTESHFYLNLDVAVAAGQANSAISPTGAGHVVERLTTRGTAADYLVYATDGTGTVGTGTFIGVLEYTVYDDGKAESAV